MKLFAGSSNKPLAEKVADKLGINLSPIDVHIFPDGERRIRIVESVVGEHVFVLQSANTPVDTNYMELFFLIDALKRSGAEYVSAIVPYFGYQRQDHIFQDGEAVSLEVVIKILESLKIDRLMSFDMHSIRIPDLFTTAVSHLSALPLFASVIASDKGVSQDAVLISPDMGGIARVKKVSTLLSDMPYAVVEKQRDLGSGKVTFGGIVRGSIEGKKQAIIIDDMISSGQTILLAAEGLKKQGIEKIDVFATHAIFSEDASKQLEESVIGSITVTDTVAIPKDKQFPKLKILTVADIIANEIQATSH